jgi:uncharacterized membrane protein YfcA
MKQEVIMKRKFGLILKDSFLPLFFIALIFCLPLKLQADESSIATQELTAGSPLTLNGTINKGEELYVVVTSTDYFKASSSQGSKEKSKLEKQFGETAIPPIYYIITSDPDSLAKPKAVTKGQTKGPFAFAPFKYQVQVNKIKPWDEIPSKIRENLLGSISSQLQWEFLIYSHENKFGINTITKETQSGGGNARMVLTDYQQHPEPWNKNVSLSLDKATGNYSVTLTPYKNMPPDTRLGVYINGEQTKHITVKPSGYYFSTANTYMNPLVVIFGSFIIGVLFVIMGAAGGLFTAAFQITILGTMGPLGVNSANIIKPTNLFLTLCSPVTGLTTYFRERRFAWPLGLSFAIGIAIGAFWLGPEYSAKYLPMKAYKFYLGIVCLVIGVKLFIESLPSSLAKKKATKAIMQRFNEAVKKAKENGTAPEMGKVEIEKFSIIKCDMKFWGETFAARPLLMLVSGVVMGMIASSFGVGGGFMFMPFMTSVLGYPMHLAVPIALAGTFATSLGGIAKYTMMGYAPDWAMAGCIAIGAIGGGMVGPKIQKRLPEVFLKRLLALALIIVFLKYTGAIPFLR